VIALHRLLPARALLLSRLLRPQLDHVPAAASVAGSRAHRGRILCSVGRARHGAWWRWPPRRGPQHAPRQASCRAPEAHCRSSAGPRSALTAGRPAKKTNGRTPVTLLCNLLCRLPRRRPSQILLLVAPL
jgi:hypothetical protein